VRPLRAGLRDVTFGDLLGQVLGQIADALLGVLGPGEHPLGVELGPEPGHMPGLVRRADGVERRIPGLQDFPGGRVDVVAGIFIPGGQPVSGEPDLLGGGPPDLVIGGGQDLA